MVHRPAVCFNDADCEPNGNTIPRRLFDATHQYDSACPPCKVVAQTWVLKFHFEANHERLLLALFLCFHALLLSADFSCMKFKRMQTTSWVPFDLLGQVRHEELKKLPREKPSVWKSFRVKCTSACTFGVFGLFTSGCKGAFVLCHNSDCRVYSEYLAPFCSISSVRQCPLCPLGLLPRITSQLYFLALPC